jgi:hypothetical protein
MAYTITITDDLARRIERYRADWQEASDAEENGHYPAWHDIDDEAHSIVDCISDLPRRQEAPNPPQLVDGDWDQGSIRLTVTEEIVTTVYLHPDRAPAGYDLTEDTDGLVATAVAHATSYNLGDISVIERDIDGLDATDRG